jgi:fatty acid desaturase
MFGASCAKPSRPQEGTSCSRVHSASWLKCVHSHGLVGAGVPAEHHGSRRQLNSDRWGGVPIQLGERRVLHPGRWRWLPAVAWLVLVFFLTAGAFGIPLQAAVDLLPPGNAALDFAGLLVACAAALGCYALAVQVGEGRGAPGRAVLTAIEPPRLLPETVALKR